MAGLAAGLEDLFAANLEAAGGLGNVLGMTAVSNLPNAIGAAAKKYTTGATRSGQRYKRTNSGSFKHNPIVPRVHRSINFLHNEGMTMHRTQSHDHPTPGLIHGQNKGGGGPSSRSVEHDEVPVIPPPKRLALTAPDYFTINLPWSFTTYHSAAKVDTGTDIRVYRLNSVYDPDISGVNRQPMGRDSWAGIYQYYRVIASRIKIHVINKTNNTETYGSPPVINTHLIGLEHTDDNAATGLTQSKESFMESKNAKTRILAGPDEAPANMAILDFDYSPQTWDDHVTNVGIEERWTAVGANPTYNHYLAFRLFPWFDGDTSTALLHYRVDIMYTVQFRELQYTVYKTEDT